MPTRLPDDVKLDAPGPTKLPDDVKLDPVSRETSPSFAQGVGTGLLDKAYGAVQTGAHLTGGYTPEALDPMQRAMLGDYAPPEQLQGPAAVKAVDETVRNREKTLEAEGYNKGWGRTVGNILGDIGITAPLSFMAPEAAPMGLASRVAQGARLGAAGGAVSGAVEPATGQNFAAEKAGQIGVGAAFGGVVGGAGGAVSSAIRDPIVGRAPVRPEAKSMVKAGYVLPPTEAPPLGEKPSLTSRTLGAESGKIKLQQEASTRNQLNTNKLAAQSIGLHPETTLTDQAFEAARAPAKAVYTEVHQAVPEVALGADETFRSEVAEIGGRKGLVEQFFPEMKNNPEIVELRNSLLANQNAPTQAVMDKIADLRKQASTNFRAVGDAQKHALALAQRDAASVMENAVERSIKNATQYNETKLLNARREQAEATKLFGTITESVKAHQQWGTPNSQQIVAGELSRAEERVAVANADVERWQAALNKSRDRSAENQTLADRFRDARKLFAKIYNVEDATNRTTGNVSAPGLARIYNKGAPFTGELKTIADAYNAAPKAMQIPESFGRAEDWSALDFFGATLSLASGHVAPAAGILGRPVARRTLLGRPYQERMVNPPPPSDSVITPRAAGPLGGLVGEGAISAFGLE